jgi:membrane-associated phospholipid phosphatase
MKYLKIIILSLIASSCFAQGLTASKVYKINAWSSGAIILGGAITNALGLTYILQDKEQIPQSTLMQLNENDVWAFDRIALNQNLEQRESWEKISDLGFTITNVLPVFLFLDKSIAKDWKDIILLFAKTQVVSSLSFTFNPVGPAVVNRFRPKTYYQELPFEERDGGNNKNSFFSGHASTTASASFFIAKVYADYHPDMKGKIWLYGAALIPPAIVGLGRVKGLFHFPSDVIIGTAIGAAVGILIPQLHKNNSKVNMSLFQFNDAAGLALRINI